LIIDIRSLVEVVSAGRLRASPLVERY